MTTWAPFPLRSVASNAEQASFRATLAPCRRLHQQVQILLLPDRRPAVADRQALFARRPVGQLS